MKYTVEQRGTKWVVVKTGIGSTDVVGKFDTEDEAKKHMADLTAEDKAGGGKPSAPPFGKK